MSEKNSRNMTDWERKATDEFIDASFDGADAFVSPSKMGAWTSDGAFTVEWQDDDHVKVTKRCREFDDVAILTGGDFETILETLFTQAKVTRIHRDSHTGEQPKTN